MEDETIETTEETVEETTEDAEETEDSTTDDTADSDEDDSTDESESTLESEVFEDLAAELSITDPLYNESLLAVKVKSAIRDVKRARNYPSSYSDETIQSDLYRYYSNVRSIALYDYNQTGAEGQSQSNENGTNRTYIDRNKLFGGIIPIARI